ncbi:MAG: zinc-binding dehydrogenase [Chloroflexi bacterium]|nr:MAG: zinc-binding dehydrogenase [Chloroflexota bacterium]
MIATTAAYTAYRHPRSIPTRTLAWNVYGVGVERVGRDGRPEAVAVGSPASDQILVRVDAVGLCFSDVKLIRLGGDHPKLYGRDLAQEPTRLGHEAAVTVVTVGSDLATRFHPGQRLAIQPDIYVNGRSTAYGYTIPGGLIGYHLIGPEVLAADDGAYVVEVDDRFGYAETALTEPWACVEAAYTQRRRLEPLAGGRAWVVGNVGDAHPYRFGRILAGSREIVLTEVSRDVATQIRAAAAPETMIAIADAAAVKGPFDDVIMLAPRSAQRVREAADALAFRGVLNLVGDAPLDGPVDIDVGRIHYHYTAYVGSPGPDVGAAYGAARNRAELLPGGVALFVGAAGPMGQMHLERALRLPDGPERFIGIDLDADRLEAAKKRLDPVAAEYGRDLTMAVPHGEELAALVARLTGGRGADDVIVSAPSARAIADAAGAMAPRGMLVVFAGVPVGTRAPLDLSRVFLHGAQYTGTSGSRIGDQQRVVDKTLAGELSPRHALAAVGGIEAAADGLHALMESRFPGKIVIFPQLRSLPLTSLEDLAAADPQIAAALGEDGAWTTEAEAVLFARYWSADAA